MIAPSLSITSIATKNLRIFQGLSIVLCLLFFGMPVFAESHTKSDEKEEKKIETPFLKKQLLKQDLTEQTLSTMLDFVELQDRLRKDLDVLQKELKASKSETETVELKVEIKVIQEKLNDTRGNIENIAADTDLGLLKSVEQKPFDLQKEIMALLEPALKEMKYATSAVRKKSDLREKIDYFTGSQLLGEIRPSAKWGKFNDIS